MWSRQRSIEDWLVRCAPLTFIDSGPAAAPGPGDGQEAAAGELWRHLAARGCLVPPGGKRKEAGGWIKEVARKDYIFNVLEIKS